MSNLGTNLISKYMDINRAPISETKKTRGGILSKGPSPMCYFGLGLWISPKFKHCITTTDLKIIRKEVPIW